MIIINKLVRRVKSIYRLIKKESSVGSRLKQETVHCTNNSSHIDIYDMHNIYKRIANNEIVATRQRTKSIFL